MKSMTEPAHEVVGGVDTHRDLHVAAVVDGLGRIRATEQFAASAAGYRQLLSWMRSFGVLQKVGIEGTGAYGAGLARYLAEQSVPVVEVDRPNRQVRRRRGKSDTTDAEAAARAVLSGESSGIPKAGVGAAEGIRTLRVARRGAVKACTQAGNELRDLIVCAPEQLRARMTRLSTKKRVELAARFRPGDPTDPIETLKAAMRSVARRHQHLQAEIADLDRRLAVLLEEAAPEGFTDGMGIGLQVATTLVAIVGDNPERLRSEASFAALCGSSPVDASSGKQVRHRLNRGGNREANSALWQIAFTRMHFEPRTKAYVERRRAEGKTDKEILRCLKRYIAREVFRALVAQQCSSAGSGELQPAA